MSGGCPEAPDSGAASPAGPSEERGSGEWRRIYDRLEALLPRVDELAADRARLEEINKSQQELTKARENSLRARLLQADASRTRWKTAYIELPLLANPKIKELQENDLKDYRTCEDADNLQLLVQPNEARSSVELKQNNQDHEGIAGDLRAELRKLKQSYETLNSNKDKEICLLLGVKDFVWNQLRTIDKENMELLKIKEAEAAQAAEAAQKLQQNIEEMQLAAQKLQQNIEETQMATQYKDDEIGRSRAEALNAKKRALIIDGKLLEMHSLVKEKNNEIEKLKIEKLKYEADQKGWKTSYERHREQCTFATNTRTQLYQKLLWEHRSVCDEYIRLQVLHDKAKADAEDPAQVKELLGRISEIEAEKSTLSNLVDQLKEGDKTHNAELQREREEVSWLKKEIEDLESKHQADITQVTESSQAEIAKAKQEFKDKGKQAVTEVEKRLSADIAKQKKEIETLDHMNNLQKEQVDLIAKKMEAWKEIADQLNHDMEMACRSSQDLSPLISEAFLESQDMAAEAVMEARKDKMGPHEPLWTMEDHLTAMAARIDQMAILGNDLPRAAIKAFRALWPDKTPPKKVKELCKWLTATCARLVQWRDSAGRAGADTALTFILSWYERIDFDALETVRSGSKFLDDPEVKKKCQARASIMAQYAPVHTFFEDPIQPEEAEEESEDEEDDEDDDEEVDEEFDELLIADEHRRKKPRMTEPALGETTSKTPAPEEPASKTPTSDEPASTGGSADPKTDSGAPSAQKLKYEADQKRMKTSCERHREQCTANEEVPVDAAGFEDEFESHEDFLEGVGLWSKYSHDPSQYQLEPMMESDQEFPDKSANK